jgi:hypothetical protein
MKIFENKGKCLICEDNKTSAGKIIFKTVAITAAVLAFVPTVFKINKGRGFEGYALLSKVEYEKSTDEEGKVRRDVRINLLDLERYGVDLNKNKETCDQTYENVEDSISIEE